MSDRSVLNISRGGAVVIALAILTTVGFVHVPVATASGSPLPNDAAETGGQLTDQPATAYTGISLRQTSRPALLHTKDDTTNFTNETVLDGLNSPIELTFLPDGRLLVLLKNGKILIANASGASETYMTIENISTNGERGLLGIALDPNFQNNSYFYLYYTGGDNYNKIARFEHEENSGGLSSRGNRSAETVLWVNPDDADNCCHFGGGFVIGGDGKIYLATGEEFEGQQAQNLSKADGKLIRINRDGSIPSDNPFLNDSDALDEIWAYGLRNPFTATWDNQTDRIYIGEVGGNNDTVAQEDINLAQKGANYGWPECEGFCDNPDYTDPIYTYPHNGSGASVSVGTVYRGDQFPSEYQGALFYGDYVRGWIKYLKFDDSGNVTDSHNFTENIGAPVDIHEGPDGSLWVVDIAYGNVIRISVSEGAPVITEATADPTSGLPPLEVTFNGSATDPDGDSLTYTWHFGDGTNATGRNVTHWYNDSGVYDATLEVSDGNDTTTSEPIEIAVGDPPNATVTKPENGTLFRAGDTIHFEGNATDDQDGELTGDNLTWEVRFIHDEHTHPELDGVNGSSGEFDIPTSGHDYSGDTGYYINLTATDSDGLTDTDFVVIDPDKVNLTLETNKSALSTLYLDSIKRSVPYTHDTLINFTHTVEAPTTQCADGIEYAFVSWSDGGAATHNYTVPESDSTLTANYRESGTCEATPSVEPVLQLEVDQGVSTSGSSVTSWADQSTSNNDLSANGAPTLVTNATPGGTAAISFDGSDDELVRTATLNNFSTGSQNRTIFVVASYNSTGFGGVAYGKPSCNQAFGAVVDDNGALTVQGWCDDFPSDTAGTNAGWLVQSVVLANDTFVHYKNGAQIDTATHTFDTKAAKLAVGSELDAPPYLDMDVAAVYLYDQALNESTRKTAEEYFEEKYLNDTTNDAPTAKNDSATVAPNESTTIDVLANDSDPDGTLNTSSVVIEQAPANGTVTVNDSTGAVTYDHDGSDTTSDSFQYSVADDDGARSNNATVSISISDDTTTTSPAVPVTDGLVLALNASQGVSTSNGSVTGWSDLSGQDNDLSANGAPTLFTNATTNDTAAISFDGDDDELVRTATLHGFPTRSQNRTVFVVAEYNSTGFGGVAYGEPACNNAFGAVVDDNGALTVQGWCDDFSSDTAGTDAGWLVQSVVLANDTFVHYKNGTQIDTATHTFDTRADKLAVGSELDAPPYLDMDVAAVYLYNRSLNATEHQDVDAFLQKTHLGSQDQNQPPTANNDSATVTRNESTTIDVLANDSDSDGTLNTSSVVIEEAPANGTVTVNDSTGAVTYDHDGSDTTSDAFQYSVADDDGARSNNATVSIAISDSSTTTSPAVPVTDGLVLALNASQGVSTSSGAVTEWVDLSGQDNDLSANGAPTLVTNATTNDTAAISFDGDDDELVRTDTLHGFPTRSQNRTVFVVAEYNSTGFGGVAYGEPACNNAFGAVVDDAGALTVQGWCDDFSSDTAGTNAGWLVQSVVLANDTFVHYKNSTEIDTATHTFETKATKLAVGSELNAPPYLDMDVAAVYLYNRSLNATEHQDVVTFLETTHLGSQNQPPTANNDSATVTRNESTTIDVLANDSDSDGTLNTSSVVIEQAPTNGTVTVNDSTGAVTYDHDGSDTTSDSFQYSVADDDGARSNNATVSISISDDTTTQNPAVPVTDGLVLALNASQGVSTSSGAVTGWSDLSGQDNDLSANGAPTLVTNATVNDTAAISFDGDDDELVRTATLHGFPTGSHNRTVFVVAEYNSTGFGGVAYGSASCNNAFGAVVDDNGDLTVQGWCDDFSSGTAGTGAGWLVQSIVLSNDTFVHYQSSTEIDSGSHVFDTTTEKLAIGSELDAPPYLDMDVAAVYLYNRSLNATQHQEVVTFLETTHLRNQPPTANNDSATVTRNESTTIDVLANDSDSDGTLNTSSVVIEQAPANGTVTVNDSTGAVTYDHDGSDTTSDSFQYSVADDDGARSNNATVSISISDSTTTTSPAVPVTDGLVLALNASQGVSTSSGAVTGWSDLSGQDNDLSANGAPTLEPNGTPNGTAAISFDGSDDELVRTATLNNFPTGSHNRTVFVVTRYNSTGFGGVAYGKPSCNKAFGAVVDDNGALTVQGWCDDFSSDTAGTDAGWLVQSVVLANDTFVHYKNGTEIDNGSHTFDTRADKLAVGSELNAPPYLDMDVAAVYLYNRSLNATEHQDVDAFLQETHLGYQNGGDTSLQESHLGSEDQPPTANNDSTTVTRNESTTIDVLANDGDPDGTLNTSSVVIKRAPSHGTVTVNDSTGAVTYDHDGSDSTSDSFQYSVADDDGARPADATVTIAISPPAPTSTPTSIEVIPTDDGGTRISVENAPVNDPVSVDVPDEVEETITSGGVTLDAVELSVTEQTDVSLTIDLPPEPPSDTPPVTESTDVEDMTYLRVAHPSLPQEVIDTIAFAFAVQKSTVGDRSPENLTVYRYHDGSWNELPTTIDRETPDAYVVQTQSPGLSVFAVGIDGGPIEKTGRRGPVDPPTAELGISTVRIANTTVGTPAPAATVATVTPGEPVTITATLENDGEAEGDFVAWVATEDDIGERLTQQTIDHVGIGDQRTVQFTVSFSQPGTHTLVLSGRRIGQVRVNDPTPAPTPDWDTEAARDWFADRYPHLAFEVWAPAFNQSVLPNAPSNGTNTSNATATASAVPVAAPKQAATVGSESVFDRR